MPHQRRQSRALSSLSLIWVLASILALFTAENIWIDPWMKSKSRDVPSLVPEPLSGVWFLALLVIGLICLFLIVAQVFVAKDRGIPVYKRMGTGSATLIALVLCVLWVRVTSGMSSAPAFGQGSKDHFVTLTWNASKSAVKGYNVYRGTHPGGPYLRINSELVRELTYKDEDVQSGTTYYYVTRAVNADSTESANSEEITARIP